MAPHSWLLFDSSSRHVLIQLKFHTRNVTQSLLKIITAGASIHITTHSVDDGNPQRCSSLQTENDLWEAWNKTGHQGNTWNHVEIPLRKLRNFQVIFEGVRSRDVSGGAALDDLEFKDCAPSR